MTHIKDPDARLDYTWDFTAWLTDGDQIATATIHDTTAGTVADNLSHNADTVTAWITGGEPDSTAQITIRITTTQGRIDDRTLTLNIAHR